MRKSVTASQGGERDPVAPQQELLQALCRLDGQCRHEPAADCRHWLERPTRFLVGDHIAIDRWSGAVADSGVFSVLEPWLDTGTRDDDGWEPIWLELDLQRLFRAGAEPAWAALGLLMLTLVDFADGWVPLGFGAAKGYGISRTERGRIEIEWPEGTSLGESSSTTLAAVMDSAETPSWKKAMAMAWDKRCQSRKDAEPVGVEVES